MLQKRKVYRAVKFQAQTLREVETHLFQEYRKQHVANWGGEAELSTDPSTASWIMQFDGSVDNAQEEWTFGSLTEWIAAHKSADAVYARFDLRPYYGPRVEVGFRGTESEVTVGGDSRDEVERVFEIFERGLKDGKIESSEVSERLGHVVEIFIGHGRSAAWRDLKDHLQDKQGFTVVAYETGARAGLSIQEVLEDMSGRAGFALLVHTAEDAAEDGEQGRARQNVVHETGLFQGRLGFRRAIILREENCEGFSNVVGTNELRFTRGHIAEIYGDVLATIRREFGGLI